MTSRPKRMLERGAPSDLWRHTLSNIPAVFGRIVYLAGVRNPNTARYEHHGMALVYGYPETDRVLYESHRTIFREWLNFDLRTKREDLELFLSSSLGPRKRVLDTWARLKPYLALIPINADDAERELFRSEVETLLKLLMSEHGLAWPNAGA